MKLSVEWIKEYVALEADAAEIAERLTMAGLEVEETEESAIGPVLNITVTPNRGDCLSVLGVARELAALYNLPLKQPQAAASTPGGAAGKATRVSIEAPDLCTRYAARIVRNLRIGDSPRWMQDRLTAAGMRPVNNLVDVTNYVMLETGQPLHAFDMDTLKEGRIVVRRAAEGETILTLDGQPRTLTPEMLVICDAGRPVAVAGIMGGGETEMTEKTQTMLLESAHFDPVSIRRTSKKLGLRTEASYRFERVVDPELVAFAADRACALIQELGMGEVLDGIVDVYPSPAERRPLTVRPARVSAMLGFAVTREEVAGNLARLGFEVLDTSYAEEAVPVRVPSWRTDVVREIDLVEEVGRVAGYEHIPEGLPTGATTQGRDSAWALFAEQIRDVMVGAGLQEIVAHSLVAPSSLEDCREEGRRIAIRSALSAELSGLRRSLLPGLLDTMDRNARRGQSPLAFFELGKVFHGSDGVYEETTSVAAALCGAVAPTAWQKGARSGAADYYTARGIAERLADALGHLSFAFVPSDDPRLHPGRSADLLLDGKKVGVLGELHPDQVADLHIRERVVVFELSVDALQTAAAAGARFKPLSPFQAVVRDIAPRLSSDVPFAKVRAAVDSAAVSFLEKVELTDVFTGAPLPEGTRSLTLSFTFRAADRTLTEAEVNEALAAIRGALERDCEASFAG